MAIHRSRPTVLAIRGTCGSCLGGNCFCLGMTGSFTLYSALLLALKQGRCEKIYCSVSRLILWRLPLALRRAGLGWYRRGYQERQCLAYWWQVVRAVYRNRRMPVVKQRQAKHGAQPVLY